MYPFVDDQQRPDPAPEQPPEGAMSYDEFIRSRSNDPELQTLRILVDHLLIAETQAHDNRERIYQEISAGRKDLSSGFQEILANDRNGSCQRIGFLVGYASAFHMQSTFLTHARTIFGGHDFADYYHFTRWNAPAGVADFNGAMNDDAATTTAPETDREPPANGAVGQNGHAETNGHSGTNSMDHAQTAVVSGNGLVSVNGASGDPHLVITRDDTGGYTAPPVEE